LVSIAKYYPDFFKKFFEFASFMIKGRDTKKVVITILVNNS
jgi:hypothetical protein